MAADIHGILLLDKPLGRELGGRGGARQAAVRCAQGGPHRIARSARLGDAADLSSAKRPSSARSCSMRTRPTGSRVRLGERTASADRESAVIERRELPRYSVRTDRAGARGVSARVRAGAADAFGHQAGRQAALRIRARGRWRERAPRAIVIHEMRLLDWQAPDLSFDVRCTKGAYIRVLAEDLARGSTPSGMWSACAGSAVAPFASQPQWTLRDVGVHDAGRAPGGAAAGRCRIDRLAATGFAGGRGERVSARPDRVDTGGTARETYGSMRPGSDFWGWGRSKPAGRLVPLRLISAATNRA